MKVYVADAYENFRILLASVLRHDGDDVLELRDGPSLLAAVLAAEPDVIVAELRLPGMSALEIVETLRAKNLAVPVVVTTGEAPEDVPLDGRHRGVRVLRKPFRVDDLRGVVSALLSPAE